jgi:hypothetical protein
LPEFYSSTVESDNKNYYSFPSNGNTRRPSIYVPLLTTISYSNLQFITFVYITLDAVLPPSKNVLLDILQDLVFVLIILDLFISVFYTLYTEFIFIYVKCEFITEPSNILISLNLFPVTLARTISQLLNVHFCVFVQENDVSSLISSCANSEFYILSISHLTYLHIYDNSSHDLNLVYINIHRLTDSNSVDSIVE